MTDFKQAITGMTLAALGFSLFSIGDVFVKYIGNEMTNAQIAFWISLALIIGYLSISPEVGGLKKTIQTKKLKWHLLKGLCGIGVFFLMINGFKVLGLAMSYTLLFIGPFLSTILAVIFLKDKVHYHRWISIICGFIGVLVVLRPGYIPIEPAAIGVLFAALFFAISSIITRKIGETEQTLSFVLYTSIVCLVVCGVIMIFQGGFNELPSVEQLALLISVAFFHVGGNFAVTNAFKNTETAIVAPFLYIQLLWGIGFGYILFDSVIDLWTGIGASIIVFSGLYLIYRESIKHTKLNRGVTTHGSID